MKKTKVSAIQVDLRGPLTVFAIIVLSLLFAISAAQAKDQLTQGLKVGETIPQEMMAADQSGEKYSLRSIAGRSGLILLFTRSLDW